MLVKAGSISHSDSSLLAQGYINSIVLSILPTSLFYKYTLSSSFMDLDLSYTQNVNCFLNKVRALSPNPRKSIRPTILLQLIFLDQNKLRNFRTSSCFNVLVLCLHFIGFHNYMFYRRQTQCLSPQYVTLISVVIYPLHKIIFSICLYKSTQCREKIIVLCHML